MAVSKDAFRRITGLAVGRYGLLIERFSALGIFLLLAGACLYVARPLLAPIAAAAVVGIILGPLATASARCRIPSAVFAVVGVLLSLLLVNLAVMLFASVISDWAARMPEIADALKVKAQFLNRPLAALREFNSMLSPGAGTTAQVEMPASDTIARALEYLTPAVGQLFLFSVSLFFFLLSRNRHRLLVVKLLEGQEQRLRGLRILNGIENDLTRYVVIITPINIGVGLVTMGIMWTLGLPNPLLWGAAAAVLNYVPYVGPAVMTINLLVLGLVTQATLLIALLGPALFLALVTLEGGILTPSIIGLRLTVSPLALFLSFAFWTWLWGPIGTFLATPFMIAMEAIYDHTIAAESGHLPG